VISYVPEGFVVQDIGTPYLLTLNFRLIFFSEPYRNYYRRVNNAV